MSLLNEKQREPLGRFFAIGKTYFQQRRIGRIKLDQAKLVFTLIAVGALLYVAWTSWPSLALRAYHIRQEYLITSVLTCMLLHVVAPVVATMALKACGSPISYHIAFKAHAGRLPARYLPGGIWHTVARMVDFHHIGVKRNHLTCLIFLETILHAGVTLTVGGIYVWCFYGDTAWANIGVVVAMGGVIGLAVSPLVINSLILKDSGPLLIYSYLKTVATTVVFWFISATAFIFYLSTFPLALDDTSVLEIGGVYMFSWGIGYIAFFSPQGIGVFEAVAGSLLSDQISIGEMAVLISGFRLVTLVSDVIIWGFSLMTPIRRGKPLA